jgi:hypothetical protein
MFIQCDEKPMKLVYDTKDSLCIEKQHQVCTVSRCNHTNLATAWAKPAPLPPAPRSKMVLGTSIGSRVLGSNDVLCIESMI